jgi:natural product precursor
MNKSSKKLALKKMTITNLNSNEMSQVAGGSSYGCWVPTWVGAAPKTKK